MQLRDYYNDLIRPGRNARVERTLRSLPHYDEARRDYAEAMRARLRV